MQVNNNNPLDKSETVKMINTLNNYNNFHNSLILITSAPERKREERSVKRVKENNDAAMFIV